MTIDLGRAVIGGLVGTAVMTMVGLFAAPMMGLPPMNPGTARRGDGWQLGAGRGNTS